MDSNLIVLGAWLLAGLITLFGLSRLLAFGAGADAHLAPRRRAPKPVSAGAARRQRSLWPALGAAVPGVLAGLFLLVIAESALWPEQKTGDLKAGLVEPGPAGVMLSEVEPSAAEPGRRASRSQSRERRRARSRRRPASASAASAPQVVAGSPVAFQPSAPAGSPVSTQPPRSRPQRRRRTPGGSKPGAADPSPSPSPTTVVPGSAPLPDSVAVVAASPPAAAGDPAGDGADDTKQGRRPAHAGPPGQAKDKDKGGGNGKGKGKGPRGRG